MRKLQDACGLEGPETGSKQGLDELAFKVALDSSPVMEGCRYRSCHALWDMTEWPTAFAT